MEHWFVYYKLPVADLPEVEARVRVMQGALAAASGVHGRLMRRPEDGPVLTLMEVYERIEDPAAFGPVLEEAVAYAGLPSAWVQSRRTERFRDL